MEVERESKTDTWQPFQSLQLFFTSGLQQNFSDQLADTIIDIETDIGIREEEDLPKNTRSFGHC